MVSGKKSKKRSADRVRELVLHRIQIREYAPSEKIHTIAELANELSVSCITVSQAVKELVDAGYLTTTRGKGCFVSRNIPRIGAPGGQKVGILLPVKPVEAQKSAWMSAIIEPIRERYVGDGWQIHLQQALNVLWYDGPIIKDPPDLRALELSAFVSIGIYDHLLLAKLAEQGLPGIALDVDASDLGIDSVFFDNTHSAIRMINWLAMRGARRIAFIGGPRKSRDQKERQNYDPCALQRYEGWRMGMDLCSLPAEDLAFFVHRRSDEFYAPVVKQMLGADTRPDAVVAEEPAVVIRELGREGIGPQDIPVVGWIGQQSGKNLPAGVPMVCVCDPGELGRSACEALERILDDQTWDSAINRVAIPPEMKTTNATAVG